VRFGNDLSPESPYRAIHPENPPVADSKGLLRNLNSQRTRSSGSKGFFIVTRALLRIAGPVETSSLDDLRATVKEPQTDILAKQRRKTGPSYSKS